MFPRQLQCIIRPLLRLNSLGARPARCQYSDEECKCGCVKDGGKCTCGPNCTCPHCSKLEKISPCRVGPAPRSERDPPPCYDPKCMQHKAFTPGNFIDLRIYRPLKGTEVLGPNASKCAEYKNPEFYSYHRFSYYDLKKLTKKLATKAAKPKNDCK